MLVREYGCQNIENCTDCHILAYIGVIFTILVPTLFPMAGKAFSDVGRAASPAKSNIIDNNIVKITPLEVKIRANSAVLCSLAAILDYGNRIAKTTSGIVLQPLVIHKKWF